MGEKILRFFIALALTLTVMNPPCAVWANNLDISNTQVESQNTADSTLKIQFDISWDNSWRDTINYDAVWVFVKYSADGGQTWKHATMKRSGTNPDGFYTGSGTALEMIGPSDKKGLFFQRSGGGNGSVSATGVQILWDYGFDGLSDVQANSQQTLIKVLGIEMVYIPSASFYIGDGNGALESEAAFHVADNLSAQITANPLTGVTVDSNGYDDLDTTPVAIDGDGGITGNSAWPTGYEAFYLMKYEITEGQWVEFFNTLSQAQKTNRDVTGALGKNTDSAVLRNTLSWDLLEARTQRPDRGCGFLSWMDLCAYADWAALRPMTELEYEKAARGPASSVYGEHPWGTVGISAALSLSGSENGSETVSTPGANAHYENTILSGGDESQGPVRVGIFSKISSTRVQAGAGYYGNMELAGNLAERCVSLGNPSGRSFLGTVGDGELTGTTGYEGNATNVDWPGIDAVNARGITGASGSGFRGGSYVDLLAALRVSDRSAASSTDSLREPGYGGRAARATS